MIRTGAGGGAGGGITGASGAGTGAGVGTGAGRGAGTGVFGSGGRVPDGGTQPLSVAISNRAGAIVVTRFNLARFGLVTLPRSFS